MGETPNTVALLIAFVSSHCGPVIHYFHQYWCLSWSPIFSFKAGSKCRLIRLIFQWARGRFLFDHSNLILISVIASLFKPEIQTAPSHQSSQSRWGKERLRFVSVTSCNPVFQFISVCLSFVLFLAQRHMFLSFLFSVLRRNYNPLPRNKAMKYK